MPQLVQAPGWQQAIQGAAKGLLGVQAGQEHRQKFASEMAEYDVQRRVAEARIAELQRKEEEAKEFKQAGAKFGELGLQSLQAEFPDPAMPPGQYGPPVADNLPPQFRSILQHAPEAIKSIPEKFRGQFVEDLRQSLGRGVVQQNSAELADQIQDMLARGSAGGAMPPALVKELGGYADELKSPGLSVERLQVIEQGVNAAMDGQQELLSDMQWGAELEAQLGELKAGTKDPGILMQLNWIASGLKLGRLKPKDAMTAMTQLTQAGIYGPIREEANELRRLGLQQQQEIALLKQQLAERRANQEDRKLDQGDQKLELGKGMQAWRQKDADRKYELMREELKIKQGSQDDVNARAVYTSLARQRGSAFDATPVTADDVRKGMGALGGSATGSDPKATIDEMLKSGKSNEEIEKWAKENGVDLNAILGG